MTAQKRGRLIYISSGLATHHPIPGKLASATAKTSLSMFVRYMAEVDLARVAAAFGRCPVNDLGGPA